MLEGLSFRFLLLVAALILVPSGLLVGGNLLAIGHREHSTSWSLQDVSDEGRTLTIGYVGSSCDSPDRVEKSETATSVRILVVLHRSRFRRHCDEGEGFVSDLALQTPLAGRALVDGHTGRRPHVAEHVAPWTLVDVSETGPALTISFRGSSCDELNRVDRRELRETTEITVRIALSLEGGCVADVLRRRVVALSRPLGDRGLRDGQTGRPPPGFSDGR